MPSSRCRLSAVRFDLSLMKSTWSSAGHTFGSAVPPVQFHRPPQDSQRNPQLPSSLQNSSLSYTQQKTPGAEAARHGCGESSEVLASVVSKQHQELLQWTLALLSINPAPGVNLWVCYGNYTVMDLPALSCLCLNQRNLCLCSLFQFLSRLTSEQLGCT